MSINMRRTVSPAAGDQQTGHIIKYATRGGKKMMKADRRMRIEYKCEWEELYISFDMHARMHTHYGGGRWQSGCIISLKTIKSAVARTISHYIAR